MIVFPLETDVLPNVNNAPVTSVEAIDPKLKLPVVDAEGKIKVIFTQGDFVSYTWPDLIYQASQLAKASFMKGFSFNTLLIMMVVYGVALVAAMKAIL